MEKIIKEKLGLMSYQDEEDMIDCCDCKAEDLKIINNIGNKIEFEFEITGSAGAGGDGVAIIYCRGIYDKDLNEVCWEVEDIDIE